MTYTRKGLLLFMTFFVAGSTVLHSQGNLAGDGVQEVMAFYSKSELEVLSSDALLSEAFLISHALRLVKSSSKPIPEWQLLPGDADTPLAQRILGSRFRPICSEFLWLQTAEGWYIMMPSLERFNHTFNRRYKAEK